MLCAFDLFLGDVIDLFLEFKNRNINNYFFKTYGKIRNTAFTQSKFGVPKCGLVVRS